MINEALNSSVIKYVNYTDVNTDLDISFNYISTVEFTNLAENEYYNLSLNNIPIAYQINGKILNNTYGNAYTDYTKPTSYTLIIYYNDQIVTSVNPTFNFYPSNDFNVNKISKNAKTFSGLFVIGYLNITNIILYGTPGYIYNFKLNINFSTSDTANDSNKTYSLYDIKESIIANVSNIYSNNCDISFKNISPTINTLGSFTISAI